MGVITQLTRFTSCCGGSAFTSSRERLETRSRLSGKPQLCDLSRLLEGKPGRSRQIHQGGRSPVRHHRLGQDFRRVELERVASVEICVGHRVGPPPRARRRPRTTQLAFRGGRGNQPRRTVLSLPLVFAICSLSVLLFFAGCGDDGGGGGEPGARSPASGETTSSGQPSGSDVVATCAGETGQSLTAANAKPSFLACLKRLDAPASVISSWEE